MEDLKQTNFMFQIDNFSEKDSVISSPTFFSGDCKWFVQVRPKGNIIEDYWCVHLVVADPKSLRLGWKRRASCSFVLLNQSEFCQWYSAQIPGWGKPVLVKKLQEKGFLEKDKLILKVEVKVFEVVDEGDVTGKETLDLYGLQVLYSQVKSVNSVFIKHPDIAVAFRLTNPLVKTTYMNLLLGLMETLNKPPHSLSETEISNARSELMELTEAGFKLDWLKTKLDEVFLERKKENSDESQMEEFEERIKNLRVELKKEKVKFAISAAKVSSLEETMRKLRAEQNMEKFKAATSAARDWLEGVVQSWNECKGGVAYADLRNVKMLRYQSKSHIRSLDKKCLIYKPCSKVVSMKPFGKEPKKKSVRTLLLRLKADNIILMESWTWA